MTIAPVKITLRLGHPIKGTRITARLAQTRAKQFAQRIIASGPQALPRQLVQRGIETIEISLVQDHPQKEVQLKLLLEKIILIALTAENIPQALLTSDLANEIEIQSKFKISHSIKSNLALSGAALALGAILTTAAPIAYFGFITIGLGILGIGSAALALINDYSNYRRNRNN